MNFFVIAEASFHIRGGGWRWLWIINQEIIKGKVKKALFEIKENKSEGEITTDTKLTTYLKLRNPYSTFITLKVVYKAVEHKNHSTTLMGQHNWSKKLCAHKSFKPSV